MTKPIDALKTIARYVEAKKPKTLAEAEHMLDLISVMADETILHEDAATSPPGPKSVEHRSRRWAQPHLCRSDAKGARLRLFVYFEEEPGRRSRRMKGPGHSGGTKTIALRHEQDNKSSGTGG